jgi:hypothetical protein
VAAPIPEEYVAIRLIDFRLYLRMVIFVFSENSKNYKYMGVLYVLDGQNIP